MVTKTKEPQRQNTDHDPLTVVDAIRATLAELQGRLTDLLERYHEAGDAARAARLAYEIALDAGDEKAMAASLASIREARDAQAQIVQQIRGDFPSEFGKLDARHEEAKSWLTPLREAREMATRALETAKAAQEIAEGRVRSAFSEVCGLRNAHQAALDVIRQDAASAAKEQRRAGGPA